MNCVSYPVSGHNNGPGQPPQLHGCPTLQNTHRHIITYSFHTPAPAHCSSLIQSLLHLLLLCHSYPCQRFARSSLASLLFLFQPACNRPNTARMWGDWCSGFACLISGKRFANQAGVIGVVCRDMWFNFELRTSPVISFLPSIKFGKNCQRSTCMNQLLWWPCKPTNECPNILSPYNFL